MCRERLNLNFGWRFSADFKPEYIRTDFKDTAFRLVDLPHSVSEWSSTVSERDCQKVTCYRKMFLLPPEMKGRRLALHFEGVMGCAAVFVNGRSVCAHKGGYTPFECDITEAIRENVRDEENLITVVVDSTEREDTAPYGSRGTLHDGGIYREIWLEATDKEYIYDAHLRTYLEDGQWGLECAGEISVPERREIKIYLCDGDKKLAAKVIFAENGRFSTRWLPTLRLEPWSVEAPRLYRIIITIGDEDSMEYSIGFRHIEFRPDGFYLNEKKLRLLGFVRNQLYSRLGAAATASQQREDVKLLKRLGCNFVRTGGCPPSIHFLDACDELGLMVFDEMPGCGYIGGEEWKACLIENLRELVKRDRSRTCVIMWSPRVADTPDDAAFNSEAAAAIKELDPYRPTGGVRSVPGQTAVPESVYCFDDCTGAESGLERKKNVFRPKQTYMIAGHVGGRSQAGANESLLLIEQALLHARALNTAMGDPDIAGFCGGDLSDHPVHGDIFCEGGVCRSGITDGPRVAKPVAFVYEAQSSTSFFLELFPGIGSSTAIYAFTNCDSVLLKRDGKLVAEFRPDAKQYPHLPHPPIVIDDFIGRLPCSEDGVEVKELAGLKAQFAAMSKERYLPPDLQLRSAGAVAARFKMSAEELVRLYNKYCADAKGSAVFTFEGLHNGSTVCTRTLAPVTESGLRIACDKTHLVSDASYDTTRIELTAVDGSGNRLRDRIDAVAVDVDGSIEVIGSRIFSLCAGSAVFYVRTRGGKGSAKVKITTESLGSYSVQLDVSRTNKK